MMTSARVSAGKMDSGFILPGAELDSRDRSNRQQQISQRLSGDTMHIITQNSKTPRAPGQGSTVIPFPASGAGNSEGGSAAGEVIDSAASRQVMLQRVEANYVDELLGRALRRVRAAGHVSTLMVLRLCKHRELEEAFGQQVGESLMQQGAQRIHECLRADDVLKQISDDEFAIVLDRVKRLDQVARVARRLVSACGGDYVIDDMSFSERAAIGIAVFPEDGQDCTDLIRFARIALRDADAGGMSGYRFFSEQMIEHQREQVCMFAELQRAVLEDRLQLNYQPQYALDGDQIVGVEALLRMVSESGELIYPERFIAHAEDSGLIVAIGHWVIREACQQLRRWHDTGFSNLRIAVNVSPRQLHDDQLLAVIEHAVASAGIAYSDLELELTEQSIVENLPLVQGLLHGLLEKGVRVAVDDFGTGYSSFAYLARLPVTTIKMDRSFLVDVPADARAGKTVAAMIAMARELDLEVVAEGVETPAQQAFLQAADCHIGQGFLLARPQTADVLDKLLSNVEHGAIAG